MQFSVLLYAYLAVVNAVVLVLMGLDKRRSRHRRRRRVRERTLLWLTVAGGALGAWIGMARFHHKTRHASFRVMAPLFTVLWALLLMWMLYSGVVG